MKMVLALLERTKKKQRLTECRLQHSNGSVVE
jgi:hypothetical protein